MILEPSDLCGVRLVRSGLLHFASANGHQLIAGDLIVIEESGQERLGTVVVGSSLLLPGTIVTNVSARVVRRARSADMHELGRRAAQAGGLFDAVVRHMTTLGDTRVMDAYLAPDGSALYVVLDSTPTDAQSLSDTLSAALGLPVELLVWGSASGPRPLTGPFAAGVGSDWTSWLVEPGDAPGRLELAIGGPTEGVGGTLRRLFPPAPRPSRDSGASRPMNSRTES